MPDQSSQQREDPGAQAELRVEAGGNGVLTLRGRLEARSTAVVWKDLEQRLPTSSLSVLEVDATTVEACDGAGFALLHFLRMSGMTPGAQVTIRGLREEFRKVFERFTEEDYKAHRPPLPQKRKVVEEIGATMAAALSDAREQVTFIGLIALGFVATAFRPKLMRWGEVMQVFERAGVNALPIVSLISFLVGLIIAFQSAQPLKLFGAQIFIANMIGLVMVRELGPLMTGIMLAGRSSSAFAAELGTMKVNEELNALETMGLDPVRFLVVQRITAGILLTPLLTVYAMLMGVLGGVIVMLALGFPIAAIWSQLASSLRLRDVLMGTSKGFVFGAIVSAVGCLRGLQTQKGPSAVGESTTRAVVTSILLIIIADAVFAVLAYLLKV